MKYRSTWFLYFVAILSFTIHGYCQYVPMISVALNSVSIKGSVESVTSCLSKRGCVFQKRFQVRLLVLDLVGGGGGRKGNNIQLIPWG